MSGDQQFVNGLTDRHVVTDEKNARHGQASGNSGLGERRNRLAIVSQQNEAIHGTPFQNLRIGFCRHTNVANMGKFQGWITASQAVHDVLIEDLVDQKGDQGINPFARARASNSSLPVRPVIPAAFNWRRTASASSSQRRR